MNKKYAALLLSALLVFGLTACSKTAEQEGGAGDAPAVEAPKQEENKGTGEAVQYETFTFENELKDFTIEIPSRFELAETELVDDFLQGHVYRFVSGPETFEISDIEFPGVEVNETLIEEEIEMGSGLELTRLDNIDVPNVGTFYGALVHDESLGRYNFYHRIKKDDRIISILQSRAVPYSLEEEAQNKAMLGTMKFN